MVKVHDGRSMPHAVLLGLDNFIGLQTARVLARCDVPVIGLARQPKSEFCRTKHVARVLAADLKDGDACVETLLHLGKDLETKAVLYPCDDDYVRFLSMNRAVLEPYFHISLPEPDILDALFDKEKFLKLCRNKKLRVPKTFSLHTREDALRASEELHFPCIIKPSQKDERWWKVSKTKVNKVFTAEELTREFERLSREVVPLVVQELIPGHDGMLYSLNCYFSKDSNPLITFVARKIRQWPIEVGCTSLGEECRNDEVLALGMEFFRAIPFTGLGYLEIKQSESDGNYYLIEANIGRPTGRSSLADTSGVPLLYTMHCDCTGRSLPDDREQKYTGRKWIHITWDIRSALSYFRKGELTLKEWWKSVRGEKTYAVFSLSDPMPFIIKLANIPVKIVKREF